MIARGSISTEDILALHAQRFWGRVAVGDAEQCWLWQGAGNGDGYGYVSIRSRGRWSGTSAHRVAWVLSGNAVEADQHVDHLCRNRQCVNPAHLEAVAPEVNNERGRSPSALNAQKAACDRGHAFTDANTYIDSKGGRRCRPCHRMIQAAYRARRAAS